MKYIEDWSLGYGLLRPLVNGVFRLGYRRIEIEGLDNIPQGKPVILAPNHQNGLTDALTIVYSYPPQPVFLARADIFKKKIIAAILTFLKIMPVFRIRDGYDSLSKNDKTFDACIRLLKKNKTLCLFPEATHNGQKSMLSHKKAIPRIAFLAGERTNFDLDLFIVPVGINYTHYYRFRSSLVIRYGQPISARDYYRIYREEGEIKATNTLREDLFEALTKVCVHVPDKSLYDVYAEAFTVLEKSQCIKKGIKPTPMNIFKTEQELIQKLMPILSGDSTIKEAVVTSIREYRDLKTALRVSEQSIQNDVSGKKIIGVNILLFLISLPLAIVGAFLYGWLFYICHYSVRKMAKDPSFYHTFSYGTTLVLLPVWLVILFVVSHAVFLRWWLALIFVLFSLPCGIVAWESARLIRSVRHQQWFNRLKKQNSESFRTLMANRDFIVSKLNNLL